MKHIGHIDGATTDQLWRTHPLGMLSPHELFIPSPGERENVSADYWQLVGWVMPDADGGTVWTNRTDTDKDTRPAYIRQVAEPSAAAQPAPLTGMPTLFTISTDDLVKEVLEFCNTRLDEHRGSINSENAYADCNKANTYLRELVGRITSKVNPSPTVSERVHDHALVRLDGLIADLTETVQTLELKFQTLARIQQHGSLIEQPMTFYDHAFITAYAATISAGKISLDRAIEVAHRHASIMTRNRANRP